MIPFSSINTKLVNQNKNTIEVTIILVKADNFVVSLCHWQLRPWLRLIMLTRSSKPDSTIKCACTNREKYMSYNNLKRICGILKAIKRLKLPSLALCLVT